MICKPEPRALPSPLPDWRIAISGGSIGAQEGEQDGRADDFDRRDQDVERYTKLGWAVRATAQDAEAAAQMGVDTDAVNSTVFAVASALGGLSGLLVGMYYNHIDPSMSFNAMLKGIVATVIGGIGNVPGAIFGSLVLGLTESYGIALFGATYRDLFAFVLLIAALVLRPNGLFGRSGVHSEPLTGTFLAPSRPLRVSAPVVWALGVAATALPLVYAQPYLLQTLTNAWLAGMLALSLTLIAGTAGQISLGQAALLAIGAYASALLSLDLGLPVFITILIAGALTAIIGTVLIFPAFRLVGHYVAIATLAIGQVVGLVILNWESLTQGAMGLSGIPPLSFGGHDLYSPSAVYWICLGALIVLALLQARLLSSHFGRTLRAIRDDDIAARSYGVRLDRYKSLAFAFGAFGAGVSGALSAHLFSYINYQTFDAQVSLLALTMIILGGMGNVLGAIAGAVILVGLPEAFRFTAEYRVLIYGVVLLLMIRFRPQGLFGTV